MEIEISLRMVLFWKNFLHYELAAEPTLVACPPVERNQVHA